VGVVEGSYGDDSRHLDELIAQAPEYAVDLIGREIFAQTVQTMQDL
jgi:hypothetical protein